MPVSIVVGGQLGSEGKGKVANYIVQQTKAAVAVRCGGSNSGHTVVAPSGRSVILRHLPTAVVNPDTILVLCAGSYIDVGVLLAEIAEFNVDPKRLKIAPNAVIITKDMLQAEQRQGIVASIGSTGSGTGAAVTGRIRRSSSILFASAIPELSEYIAPVGNILHNRLRYGDRIVIEGTQGFGLSLLHSPFYPAVTSRDTTAAGFLSEVGLSPMDVDDVIMVLRSFPIRVSGKSGPMIDEIDWDTVTKESGSPDDLTEFSSVSKNIRRVGRLDPGMVRKAIMYNKPTRIVMNHMDHVDHAMKTRTTLTSKAFNFVTEAEIAIGASIDYYGTNPSDIITR